MFVLVVDDEKDFLNALVARLRRRDFKTSGVASGEEALEFIKNNTTDVVVLDLKMPGIGGRETLQRLKKTHPEIEVILLTGHGAAEDGIEGVSLGAFAYLIKPVKVGELVEVITKAYNWKQAAQKESK